MNLLNEHKNYTDALLSGFDLESMTTDERWHLRRRLGIGGSDVGAILGLCRFKTGYDIFLEKTGQKESHDEPDSECLHFGKVLESTIADEYMRRTGDKVQRRNHTYINPDMPWMQANIDRLVIGRKKILECKTSTAWANKLWGEEGSDDVPESYLLQVMHYMICTGYLKADLAVLIGGNEFKIYQFEYNKQLAQLIKTRLKDFWFSHVIKNIPPEPVSLIEVNQLYSASNKETIIATPEIVESITAFREAKQQEKALREEIKTREKEIKSFMKYNEILIINDSEKPVTWKNQTRKDLDRTALKQDLPEIYTEYTKPTEIRRFSA